MICYEHCDCYFEGAPCCNCGEYFDFEYYGYPEDDLDELDE